MNNISGLSLSLATFGSDAASVSRGLLVPHLPALDPVAYAAVYVLSKGSPPTWYQLACETALSAGEESSKKNAKRCRLTATTRPRVAWKRIDLSLR